MMMTMGFEISDEFLGTFVPILVYWVYSGMYVCLGSLERYRLHSKVDEDEKNLVTKSAVVKGVLLQQTLQAIISVILFKLQGGGSEWRILERWEVPWEWQTVSLTSLACGLSFVLTGLTEMVALPYLGIDVQKLSLDDKAEILFLDQGLTTLAVLAVIFTVAKTFEPLPEDILRYDLKQPFNLQKGWLVWSGIGLVGAVGAIALTGVALSLFRTETPEREVDSLMKLLPLIGSSNISTLSLVGITGVLAPLLEETVFRGFFMVSLTKWVPTPIAIIISSAAFALAHLTPGEFPQLFMLGSVLGLSYAQTRNLITPMVIHGFWNSGVILLLTFLQVQGYDIKELLLQGN
ncbi:hypothetical protein F2Q70_00019903 [Brassica cretica]|uniref:CAAX prenyl protease 2/Lysostaphin resistance protein A-like domain-containing protein n=1 Tax=Brassica cretica TaxID=69181 RepID=A0A8S9GMK6_BRACR|nr:hypothetical protein F2Q70_00019903 [Brassica cretica]